MNHHRSFIFIIIFLCVIFTSMGFAQEYSWELLTGPYDGSATDVYIDGDDIIYGLTWGRGIYRSLNNGDNWEPISNPVHVRCLTSDLSGNLYLGSSNLYRSMDNGKTWEGIIENYTYIESIAINSEGQIFAGTWYKGIYCSTDSGETWRVNNNLGSHVISIAINDNDEIFTGTHDGIYFSKDYGNNWICLAFADTIVNKIYINSNGFLYAITSQGYYTSKDNGNSWFLINLENVRSVAFNSREVIYAATDHGIFSSNNDGDNWELIASLNTPFISIDSKDHIYANQNYGLIRSKDNGINWEIIGLPSSFVYSLFYNRNNKMFIGTTIGAFISQNNGISIENTDLKNISVRCFSSGTFESVYAGTDSGVYFSTSGGNNWKNIGLKDVTITSIWMDSLNYIYAGSFYPGGIYRSADSGKSWIHINSDIPDGIRSSFVSYDNNIFIGTTNGLYKSDDNGVTWNKIGFTGYTVVSILGRNRNEIFIAVSEGALNLECNSGIFYSKDNGVTWENLYCQDFYKIYSLTISPNNDIYFGGSKGVFLSKNNGKNWENIWNFWRQNQEPISLIIDLDCNIYIGTGGSGIFKSSYSVTSVPSYPEDNYILYQNYPNPFNPSTTIKYHLDKSSFVKLEIYNLAGQVIETLVNNFQLSGGHEITWYPRHLSNGLYFYKIQAGKLTETKKLIFQK